MGPINKGFIGQAWEKMTAAVSPVPQLQMPRTALSKLAKQTRENSRVQEQA